MEIIIKKLNDGAKLPTYAHVTDPGISLYANEEVTIEAGQRVAVGTGVAIAIPVGFIGLVWHKDSVPSADGLVAKGVVVDSGFRKEIKVELINHDSESISVSHGDRIAQMLIQKVEQPHIIEAEDLSDAVE